MFVGHGAVLRASSGDSRAESHVRSAACVTTEYAMEKHVIMKMEKRTLYATPPRVRIYDVVAECGFAASGGDENDGLNFEGFEDGGEF